MNNKKVLKLLVASSAIAGGIGLSGNVVQATENNNNNTANRNDLSKSATKVSIQTSGKVINVNSNLSVRSDAGENYDTIGYLCNGQDVEILSQKGDWYRISFNGREGYVSRKYISTEKDDGQASIDNETNRQETINETKKNGKAINVNTTLNIRQSASLDSAILGTLKNGDTFEIISKNGEWYNIKSHNIVGFISAKYVQEVSENQTTIENVIQTMTENYVAEKSESSISTEQGVVVNVQSNLRVRSSASLSSSTIGYLLNGQSVSIKGETAGWYNINFHGHNAYVSKEYIQKGEAHTPASLTQARTSGTGKVVNVSSSLNIRSGAGTNYSIVGSLSNGATVNIIEKSGSWYHINHNGVTGYVSGEYIQEVSGNGGSSSGESAASGTGKVVNISSSLNIRSGAGTNHSIVGSLSNGATVSIIGKNGSWYHINHNGVTGYVSGEYIQEVSGGNSTGESISSGKGQVYNVSSNLRVRSAPSTHSLVLGYLLGGEIVNIIGNSNGWVHINYKGSTGYVSAEYIKPVDNNTLTNASSTFSKVYDAMRAHLGSPYVWGGSGEYLTTSSLNALKATFSSQAARGMYDRASQYVDQGYRAFDCSGLMQWGFRQAGISIGRTTYDQINDGYEVSLSSLQPGDLLFYSNKSHVGMYIGNGQWIESPNQNADIRIANVPWSKVTRARRVIK